MSITSQKSDLWLAYMSAEPHRADYYLNKYLESLSKDDLQKLLEGFEASHGTFQNLDPR